VFPQENGLRMDLIQNQMKPKTFDEKEPVDDSMMKSYKNKLQKPVEAFLKGKKCLTGVSI
jgi:hypothetical protein